MISIYGRTGGENQLRDFQGLHHFQDIVRRQKSQSKIEVRVAPAGLDVGIGRHVPDGLDRAAAGVTPQKSETRLRVVDIHLSEGEPVIAKSASQIGAPAQGHIVQADDPVAQRQKPVH